MASERVRGCGYRKVGSIYLVSDGTVWVTCDRLPFEVGACPVCGEGVHFPRSPKQVNPMRLFGNHYEAAGCACPPSCPVCNPQAEVAYLLGVGEKYYTPTDFVLEANKMGVSKRVPAVPKNLKLGKTWIYLVHKKAKKTDVIDEKTGKATHREWKMSVFCAFIPKRIDMLVWKSELTDEKIAELEKRGITPVAIPDGDTDHATRSRTKKPKRQNPVQTELPLFHDERRHRK